MNTKRFFLAGIFAITPYVIWNYMVFIFIVPLLLLFYSNEKIKNTHLILFAFLIPCLGLSPIIIYNIGTYFFGILIVTLFLGAFLIISKILIRHFRNALFSICAPCITWTLLIYLLNVKSLIASFFDIGILVPASAPLIWYTGSIGLTTLIILFNSAVARSLAKKDAFSMLVTVILSVVFAASLIFSAIRTPGNLHASDSAIKIALIQGDVPRGSMFGHKENLDDRIKRYIGLSQKALERQKPDIVVWPEYTLPIDLLNRFPEKMQPILNAIKKSKTIFVIGSLLSEKSKKDYHYDTALIFSKNGSLKDIYYSQDPAIFTKNIYPKDNDNKLYLDNNAGITLCWEEINAKIFRKYVKQGAEYFISLSKNADLEYLQFRKYASFFSRARAAENMRYLARATQTGVTQIVNPFGKVVKRVPANRSTFLTGEIYRIRKKTFYSSYGDILTKLFIISILLSALIGEVIMRKRRQN